MATKKQTATKKTKSRTTAVRSRRTVSAKPQQAKVEQTKVGVLDYFKFGESYTSLILGIIVVIIAAILLVSFFRSNSARLNSTEQSTSSTSTVNTDQPQQDNGQKTYTVKAGDNLWQIAEDQLHDGYQWIAIAKANDLANPGDIHVGNKLVIPQNVKPIAQVNQHTPTQVQVQQAQQQSNTQTISNKITGTTYTVQHGDDLWHIAVRAYGDGYKWVDIAKANNLMNAPNLIFSGNQLSIPRG